MKNKQQVGEPADADINSANDWLSNCFAQNRKLGKFLREADAKTPDDMDMGVKCLVRMALTSHDCYNFAEEGAQAVLAGSQQFMASSDLQTP